MAMDPNKNSSSSSSAVHISPPLTGDQTSLLGPISRMPHDEEMIRTIVREEIHAREEHCKMSHNNLPPPRLLSDPKIPAQYQLQFMNQVKTTTFTTDLVRDENGHPIKVAIYDTYTKSTISPDNILSSAKVRLILLDAEFCTNKENWSPSEFVQNVLTERERKGPILTGRSLIIHLENGVGTFENIVFNDNSSWTKSGFRLGVMVTGEGEEGYLNGERVREGVSKSFRVKDRRVKASQKPDLLKLTHSIQCIKKIGKGRASFLEKKKINTVEDFLKLYYNDESALREILCIKSESGKEWESMVEHAMQCSDEFHAKYNALNSSSQPRQALVHPMVRNMSQCTNGGHVVSSGSSEPTKHGQVSPICDSSSLNRTNVERGNILNGNSVHCTNGVDAESSPNYNTQVRLGGGGGCYHHEHELFPGSFPPRDAHGWSRPRHPPPPSYRIRTIMIGVYYSLVINNLN